MNKRKDNILEVLGDFDIKLNRKEGYAFLNFDEEKINKEMNQIKSEIEVSNTDKILLKKYNNDLIKVINRLEKNKVISEDKSLIKSILVGMMSNRIINKGWGSRKGFEIWAFDQEVRMLRYLTLLDIKNTKERKEKEIASMIGEINYFSPKKIFELINGFEIKNANRIQEKLMFIETLVNHVNKSQDRKINLNLENKYREHAEIILNTDTKISNLKNYDGMYYFFNLVRGKIKKEIREMLKNQYLEVQYKDNLNYQACLGNMKYINSISEYVLKNLEEHNEKENLFDAIKSELDFVFTSELVLKDNERREFLITNEMEKINRDMKDSKYYEIKDKSNMTESKNVRHNISVEIKSDLNEDDKLKLMEFLSNMLKENIQKKILSNKSNVKMEKVLQRKDYDYADLYKTSNTKVEFLFPSKIVLFNFVKLMDEMSFNYIKTAQTPNISGIDVTSASLNEKNNNLLNQIENELNRLKSKMESGVEDNLYKTMDLLTRQRSEYVRNIWSVPNSEVRDCNVMDMENSLRFNFVFKEPSYEEMAPFLISNIAVYLRKNSLNIIDVCIYDTVVAMRDLEDLNLDVRSGLKLEVSKLLEEIDLNKSFKIYQRHIGVVKDKYAMVNVDAEMQKEISEAFEKTNLKDLLELIKSDITNNTVKVKKNL